MKVRQIQEGYFVCKVTKIDTRGFGFARYQGDFVRFQDGYGWKISAGASVPEFTDEPCSCPEVGQCIIVFVIKGRDGWLASAWGLYKEFLAAREEIRSRTLPKPAPKVTIPTVASCKGLSQIEKFHLREAKRHGHVIDGAVLSPDRAFLEDALRKEESPAVVSPQVEGDVAPSVRDPHNIPV